MSDTAESIQWAIFNGQTVEVLEVNQTEHGTIALIRDDDGREDEVPFVRLDLL